MAHRGDVAKVLEEALRNVLRYIRACVSEDCVVKQLAIELGGRGHVALGDCEVDVLVGELGIEVKLRPRPHDGIGQALCYKRLLGLPHVALVHVVDHGGPAHFKKVKKLIRDLGICVAVLDRGLGYVYVDCG